MITFIFENEDDRDDFIEEIHDEENIEFSDFYEKEKSYYVDFNISDVLKKMNMYEFHNFAADFGGKVI